MRFRLRLPRNSLLLLALPENPALVLHTRFNCNKIGYSIMV